MKFSVKITKEPVQDEGIKPWTHDVTLLSMLQQLPYTIEEDEILRQRVIEGLQLV